MLAFAANSLLCRQALGEGLIDAATFTSVRVLSGAVTLSLVVLFRRRPREPSTPSWRSSAMLFTYMAFFSFAYLSLGAGTGALILFGAIQLTMLTFAIRQGEHFSTISWAGLFLAVFGMVYLVSPGVTAPDLSAAILMAVAGVAWGGYSLLGKGAADPLEATARNFVYSVPLVLIVSLFFMDNFSSTSSGLLLAVASGSITSGCGYVIWYAVLPSLTATRAATVQLSVPAIVSFGGVILLSEELTLRLFLASAVTLGGVAIVLTQRATKVVR
ncbi:MAG: EamA family transporter [Alphaproteobacteria bacterium]|nr:EamA family transporter [Alphaproteobacteria bacterium]MBT7943875.1 EamA family transporter [Alphaproteobacteria bacterium]